MSASMLLLYGEDDEIIDVKSSEHIIKAMTQVLKKRYYTVDRSSCPWYNRN